MWKVITDKKSQNYVKQCFTLSQIENCRGAKEDSKNGFWKNKINFAERKSIIKILEEVERY